MDKPANARQVPVEPGKTAAELLADRYFEQFQQVRGGGLFGPGARPEPEPEAE